MDTRLYLKRIAELFLFILCLVGTYWAFDRGANDFRVFYHAGSLILQNLSAQIYTDSPDRYLYAPGFAWLMAPLALLSSNAALIFWSLAKAAALGGVYVLLSRLTGSWVSAFFGILFFSRSLLIDFQYGQLNLILLFFAVWVLWTSSDAKQPSSSRDSLKTEVTCLYSLSSWYLFGLFAFSKPIILLLGAIPFFNLSKNKKNFFALCLGVLTILILPVFFIGFSASIDLHQSWVNALQQKGLPLESHNQSFMAILNRLFSGDLVHVISLGSTWIPFGFKLLSKDQLSLISWYWVSGMCLAFLVLAFFYRNTSKQKTVLLSGTIIPSHLIWKTYFLFGIPLMSFLYEKINRKLFWVLFLLFNFSTFDWIGYQLAGYLEAFGILFWIYFFLVLRGIRFFR